MRGRRLRVAGCSAALTAILAASLADRVGATAGAAPAVAAATQMQSIACPSPALGGALPALVFLPTGYYEKATRYRVVYFLHGLPAGPNAYKANAFVANELDASGRRAIVVEPQGSRRGYSDREYLDWSVTEDWPRAISHDLTSCIDKRYRTIRSRYGRALIGLSAGGFGAMNIGLRALRTFAAVESWSGYFQATNPAGTAVLNLGSAQANAAATVPRGDPLKATVAARPTFIAFYVGSRDSLFLRMNKEYNRLLNHIRLRHIFRIYAGGHSEALWRTEAPYWLGMVLDGLGSEAGRHGRLQRNSSGARRLG